MAVKMKHPQHEERREQTDHQPTDAPVQGIGMTLTIPRHRLDRMRQLMKDGYSQHQSTDQTDEDLHPRMSQPDEGRKIAAEQRR